MVIGIFAIPAAFANRAAAAKISDGLTEALSVSTTAAAFVTMEDVDHTAVMEQFRLQYPLEYEVYMMAKFDVAPTSGVEITDELLQSAIERKREVYKMYYAAINRSVIESYVDAEDILYVSSYSPYAIIETTSANALRLAGTSGAAAEVTGTIAQLCSYNSALKYKQTAIGAILMASAYRKVNATGSGDKGDTFTVSERVENNPQISNVEGAGIMDARSARGIVTAGNYWSPVVYSANFPYSQTVTIDASSNTLSRVAVFWLKQNYVTDHTTLETTSAYPIGLLSINVYDPNGNLVGSSAIFRGNFEVVQFVPEISGTYSIEITAQLYTGSAEKEYIGIAVW